MSDLYLSVLLGSSFYISIYHLDFENVWRMLCIILCSSGDAFFFIDSRHCSCSSVRCSFPKNQPSTTRIPPPFPRVVYKGDDADKISISYSMVRLLTLNSIMRFFTDSKRRLLRILKISKRLSTALCISLSLLS